MRLAPEISRQVEHLLDVERFDDARRLLASPLREAPDDVELLYLAARVEHGARRYAEAEHWVAEVLGRAPEHTGARILRFQLLLKARRYAQAEQEVLSLLRERPEEALLYALYARLMLETLHVEKARALVDEALRLDPTLPLARILDALVSVVQGRLDGAKARVAELVRGSPDAEAVAWTLLAVLQSQHRYPEAFQVARELLRARPSDPQALEALIQLRAVTHWSSRPLWPLLRFGWGASMVLWVMATFGLMGVRRVAPRLGAVLGLGFLLYVIYSWVQPPLLRRWLRWRGF